MIPIPLTALDKDGADHHLYVPAAMDLAIHAYSGTYSMSDGNGVSVGKQAAYAQPFNIPAGAQQFKQTITIH
jgi:catalase (peroxidase I)